MALIGKLSHRRKLTTFVSSKPRRLAVLAVATTLAAGAPNAPAASAQASSPATPPAGSLVITEAVEVKPPPSVTGLARDLGVDTGFAWRALDELARSGAGGAR
jgi:hypothetical protein